MCPCDVACKTVRLVEIHAGSPARSAPTRSPLHASQMRWLFVAKPSVTKSATHLPVFLVFKSPRPAPQRPHGF